MEFGPISATTPSLNTNGLIEANEKAHNMWKSVFGETFDGHVSVRLSVIVSSILYIWITPGCRVIQVYNMEFAYILGYSHHQQPHTPQ